MAMKRSEINMTEGPFLKKIVRFSIPVMITGFLQTFYNAADLAVVGRFRGEIELAAVGGNTNLTTMIVGLFMGLSVGAGVMVAQQLGAKQEEEVKKTVHNAILLAVIFGVLVGAVGWILAPTLLRLVSLPEAVMPSAVLYLRIIFAGTPGLMLYNYCSAMVRSTGDTKRPLIFLTVSGVVNVLLNLMFVAVFGMSVDGVALATILSQYLSAGMILVYMMRSKSCIRFRISDVRLDRKIVGRMMYIGLPSGLQSCAFALPNLMIHVSINGLGEAAIAGNAAASSLENFIGIMMNSFYHASLTFVGQNVGAKQYRNIKRVVWQTLGCCLVVGVAGCALFWFFRDFFLGLYMSDGNVEVKAYAVKRFATMFPLYFLCGFQETLTGALRGLGKSVMALLATIFGAFVFRIFWMQVIFPMVPSFECAIMSYPISYILISAFCAVCLMIVYRTLVKSDSVSVETVD